MTKNIKIENEVYQDIDIISVESADTAGERYNFIDEGNLQELKNITIQENGNIEITPDSGFTAIKKVNVATDVNQSVEETIINSTENGTNIITPSEGNLGYSKVTINTNVPNQVEEKSVSITANGTTVYEPTSPNIGIKKLTVSTNVTSTPTEEKTVELSMASGNQVIEPTGGKVLSKVIVNKPNTLISENIKKDVNIGGIIGTLTSGTSSIDLNKKFIFLDLSSVYEYHTLNITPAVSFTNINYYHGNTDSTISYGDYDSNLSYDVIMNVPSNKKGALTVLDCFWGDDSSISATINSFSGSFNYKPGGYYYSATVPAHTANERRSIIIIFVTGADD